jgi:hypothetical protein
MAYSAPEQGEQDKEQAGNSAETIPDLAILSYYRDEAEEGGLEVKWTIRVAHGAEAARLDDRQNHAIRELLTWAHRHRR